MKKMMQFTTTAILLLLVVAGATTAFVNCPFKAVPHSEHGLRTHTQICRGERTLLGMVMKDGGELASDSLELPHDGSFEAEVLESSMPVLVDFHAEWCAPCLLIEPSVKKLAQEYEGKLKVIKVNTDVHETVAKTYKVRGLPLLAVFQDGKVLNKHEGLLAYAKLKDFATAKLPEIS
ncbi:unnamed protein product [Discosporangium mesarthrocarpum]